MSLSANIRSVDRLPIQCELQCPMKSVRHFLLVLFCLFFSSPLMAVTIVGLVHSTPSGYYLIDNENGIQRKLHPGNQQVIDTLARLKSADFISGNGDFINGEYVLENLDFVGLSELIGTWVSPHGSWMKFNSFSNLSVYTLTEERVAHRANLHYSIAPDSGHEWKVFLSDAKEVILASLLLKNNQASLKIYNSDSGEVVKVIELRKLGTYN